MSEITVSVRWLTYEHTTDWLVYEVFTLLRADSRFYREWKHCEVRCDVSSKKNKKQTKCTQKRFFDLNPKRLHQLHDGNWLLNTLSSRKYIPIIIPAVTEFHRAFDARLYNNTPPLIWRCSDKPPFCLSTLVNVHLVNNTDDTVHGDEPQASTSTHKPGLFVMRCSCLELGLRIVIHLMMTDPIYVLHSSAPQIIFCLEKGGPQNQARVSFLKSLPPSTFSYSFLHLS